MYTLEFSPTMCSNRIYLMPFFPHLKISPTKKKTKNKKQKTSPIIVFTTWTTSFTDLIKFTEQGLMFTWSGN